MKTRHTRLLDKADSIIPLSFPLLSSRLLWKYGEYAEKKREPKVKENEEESLWGQLRENLEMRKPTV